MAVDACLDILYEASRATVTVNAQIPESNPSAPVLGTRRFGTGTGVDDSGLVLTVNYIVLGANVVTLTDIDGKIYDARVVAQDFATGIALLRTEDQRIACVAAGSSAETRLGDDVFTVSSVGEEERRSGWGTVISLDPFDAYWEYRLERAVWATVANPGLGGAPLLNSGGELIAVVSLNLGAVGRSTLAVPAESYYDHARELLTHGRRISRPRRAWLGMFCYSFPDRTVVAGLVAGGPGESNGLQVGDVIVRIDGEQISDRAELYERLWRRGPGDSVELYVYRDSRLVTVAVNAGDAEEFFA